jgi:hypothetical protein
MAFEKCVDKGGNNGGRDTAFPASVSNSRASATVAAARQLFKNNKTSNPNNVETTTVKPPNGLNFQTTLPLSNFAGETRRTDDVNTVNRTQSRDNHKTKTTTTVIAEAAEKTFRQSRSGTTTFALARDKIVRESSGNTIFNETLARNTERETTAARTFNTTAANTQRKQQINGTQGDNKHGDNKQVDGKRVDHNKHAVNKLRSIEKQRISAENKEILVKYISSEQIQDKIEQITRQIKTMTRQMQNNPHLANNYQLVTERQQLIDLLVLLKLKLQEIFSSSSSVKTSQKTYKSNKNVNNSNNSSNSENYSNYRSSTSSISSFSSSIQNYLNPGQCYKLQRFKINHYGHAFGATKIIILPNKSTFCEVCTLPIIFNKAEQCQNCTIYTHSECSQEISRPCAKTENVEYIKQLYNFTPFCKNYDRSVDDDGAKNHDFGNNDFSETNDFLETATFSPEALNMSVSVHSTATVTPTRRPNTFNCYECKQKPSNPTSLKQCSLTGYFYCKTCHWDDRAVIPANVLYNWDFTRLSVCRRSFHILQEFQSQPLINVSKCNNGQLFRKIKRLGKVHRMRRKLMDMFEYIGKCKLAKIDKLLQKSLKSRCSYFLIDEQSVFYSLTDLVDIATGRLYRELKTVEAIFEDHIRVDCLICKGRGHICKVCNQGSHSLVNFDEPMFPFDKEGINTCSDCGSVYHESCFSGDGFECLTCQIYEKRKKARKQDLGPEPMNFTDGMPKFVKSQVLFCCFRQKFLALIRKKLH